MAKTLNRTRNPYSGLPQPLILYDGVCGLCNGTVQFIINRDPVGRFHFAPLQSSLAKNILLRQSDVADDLSSVVLIENGKIYLRSTAALRIARHLRGSMRLLWWLVVIPRPLRDTAYNLIARNRYGWFGKLKACRLPDPEVAGRFLMG